MEMYFFNKDTLEKILLGYHHSKKTKNYNALKKAVENYDFEKAYKLINKSI